MQQASRTKTNVETARVGKDVSAQRKPVAAPRPLDPKTLERVSGGTTALPHKYW